MEEPCSGCGAKLLRIEYGISVYECGTGEEDSGFFSRDCLWNQIHALDEKLNEVQKALSFYAEPKNWISKSKGFALQYDPEPSEIQKDKGELARMILFKNKEK